MQTSTVIIIAALLLVCLSVFSADEHENELIQVSQYCEMVEIYHTSNGKDGWQDYKNNYDEICK